VPGRFGWFWIRQANIHFGGRRLEKRELVVQIQVNTDDNIEGGEELSARVSAEIRARLDRFSKHITRIEVHISDENGDKSGESDKRCLIEARLEGRQPEVVSDHAATLERAYSGAAKKLQRALETTLGRLSQLKGADTIRTGDL
jgi:ribosome-associated translation inhibitor RaiA